MNTVRLTSHSSAVDISESDFHRPSMWLMDKRTNSAHCCPCQFSLPNRISGPWALSDKKDTTCKRMKKGPRSLKSSRKTRVAGPLNRTPATLQHLGANSPATRPRWGSGAWEECYRLRSFACCGDRRASAGGPLMRLGTSCASRTMSSLPSCSGRRKMLHEFGMGCP